jgi:hypothetical protein
MIIVAGMATVWLSLARRNNTLERYFVFSESISHPVTVPWISCMLGYCFRPTTSRRSNVSKPGLPAQRIGGRFPLYSSNGGLISFPDGKYFRSPGTILDCTLKTHHEISSKEELTGFWIGHTRRRGSGTVYCNRKRSKPVTLQRGSSIFRFDD